MTEIISLHPFTQGMITGLSFAFFLGPGGILLIQTSICNGIQSGLFLTAGNFGADIVVLFLCYVGLNSVPGDHSLQQGLIGALGCTVLIGLGLNTVIRKPLAVDCRMENEMGIRSPGRNCLFVLKGFFLNLLNPGTWFFNAALLVTVGTLYGENTRVRIMFLAGLLSTSLMTDTAKCLISNRLKPQLGHKTMTRMNLTAGILLIGCGVLLAGKILMPVIR